MPPMIDKVATGQQIKKWMEIRGLTVEDVREFLSLGCVQSIYHWLNGQSLPSVDNIYALSELLQVPMDQLVVGERKYSPKMYMEYDDRRFQQFERLMRYQRMQQDYIVSIASSGTFETFMVEVKGSHMLKPYRNQSNLVWG